MNALTLTLLRVAFLAVLWLFVIAAIGVVRTDLGPRPGIVVAEVDVSLVAEVRTALPSLTNRRGDVFG